ncbi:efflux RND transporter permease subunit [Marichromatium bheemlicum]|uniref:MMPL family transporter n=1 Tax=Marichromatium bheemlicum TaxID=365339 RepID=A0ABX1I9S8_9GAMM|nr:MMPL family transporter [Marichromatium bheemlicum]NKN34299.1 MMPL family transporter [Marichromatium bheemlicum]
MTVARLSGVLALTLLLLLGAISGALLSRIHLDNAPEAYFPSDAPAVRFESRLREDFPPDQVLIALFEGDDLFSDAALQPLFGLVEALERNPKVERVLAVSSVDHIGAAAEGFVVEPLLDDDIAAGLDSEQRRQRVLDDRLAASYLVADDGQAMALIVRPIELGDSLQRLALERDTRAAIAAAGLEGRLTALAGQVALDVAQLRAMIRDTLTFVPATMGLGLLIIWLLFRRVLAVAVSALVIAVVVNLTVALLVLAGKPYTLVSAILPPLMSALTIASLIHWLNALSQAAQRGLSGPARVDWARRRVARPTLFTALTTAAGLASLGFSSIQPIAAFGLVAAAGMLAQSAIVIGLVPPIFARWDRGSWHSGHALRPLDHAVAWLRHLGMRHAGWVLAIAALVLALGVPQIWRIHTETDMLRFFPEAHPITQANTRIQDRLIGTTTLELVFHVGARDAFKRPEHLAVIDTVQDWLEDQPEVSHTLSMVDLIEEMHWGFHDERADYRTLPRDPRLIAQYLFIYDGTDLYELVDREFARTRLTLNLDIRGARAINAFIARTEAHLADLDLQDMEVRVAGFGRLFADQEQLLIDGQIRGLAAAVVLISLFMLAMWRRPGDAALCMVPNLAPILLIFIAMGVLGIWLDMATAMIASVTAGIAIDDTIHLFHAYRRHLAAHGSRVWALARAYQHTGRAVVATTLILCGQFLLLGTSAFVPTREFGLLTAVGLLTALVFDLLLLPALLIAVGRLRDHRHRVRPHWTRH